MIISLIVAMGKNRVIGKNNQLLWRLPLEFEHFKKTTMGHHLVMGRKTFESLKGPLPGRTTIIVSKNLKYPLTSSTLLAHSLEEALIQAQMRKESEVFICGGATIYQEALQKKIVDRMYLTTVDFSEEGDAYFPDFKVAEWQKIKSEVHPISEKNPIAWSTTLWQKN